jgi:hypothetical protein
MANCGGGWWLAAAGELTLEVVLSFEAGSRPAATHLSFASPKESKQSSRSGGSLTSQSEVMRTPKGNPAVCGQKDFEVGFGFGLGVNPYPSPSGGGRNSIWEAVRFGVSDFLPALPNPTPARPGWACDD